MIDLEFIKRCEEFAKPYVEEFLENRKKRLKKWIKDNPKKQKASQALCDARRRMKKNNSNLYLSSAQKNK